MPQKAFVDGIFAMLSKPSFFFSFTIRFEYSSLGNGHANFTWKDRNYGMGGINSLMGWSKASVYFIYLFICTAPGAYIIPLRESLRYSNVTTCTDLAGRQEGKESSWAKARASSAEYFIFEVTRDFLTFDDLRGSLTERRDGDEGIWKVLGA